MSKYEIVKKNQLKKNKGKKYGATMVSLTNLLHEIWDHDNLTKKKLQKKNKWS
jgi:hypothetical protein